MKKRKTNLKRLLKFVSILLVISLNSVFAAETKSKIKNVNILGLFGSSDADSYIASDYLLPVDGREHRVEFTSDTATYIVPFTATLVKTTLQKEGNYYTDEIKIEYSSLAKTIFFKNNAMLKFKLFDENGGILLVDKVTNYRKYDYSKPGWILNNTMFPSTEVVFTTKNYSDNQGATNWAWFRMYYSYSVNEE